MSYPEGASAAGPSPDTSRWDECMGCEHHTCSQEETDDKSIHFTLDLIYTVSFKQSSCNSPVIIRVVPVIKMNQETVAHFVCYRSNTYERGVHPVHSLQLHPYLKPTVCLRLHSQKTSSMFTQSLGKKLQYRSIVFDSL